MNKRAFTLDFLLTIIVALIIFIPGCMILSDMFRLSGQAEDNFLSLYNKLQNFAEEGREGEPKSMRLILDEGTAIVYFEANKDNVVVDVDGWAARNYQVVFERPSSCPTDKNCLCLIRDKEIEDVGGYYLGESALIKPKKLSCKDDLEAPLSIVKCGIGAAKSVNSYTCKNGFVIERLLFEEARDELVSGGALDAHFELQRRTIIQMTKRGNTVVVEGKS